MAQKTDPTRRRRMEATVFPAGAYSGSFVNAVSTAS